MTSAFRLLPLKPGQVCWLVMKVKYPETGKTMFFVDKCLPFGASISCAQFQKFSDALAYITEVKADIPKELTNYLDDFLLIAFSSFDCDNHLKQFLFICETINCPVSEEKTEWLTLIIVFLSILSDSQHHRLCIPEEKRTKATKRLDWAIDKKKLTIKEIEKLMGTLNFLTRAIYPGRVFPRRMYAKLKTTDKTGRKLKPYHHVNLDSKFISDALIWRLFLDNSDPHHWCRPFVDCRRYETSQTLQFFTDSSAAGDKVFGCVFNLEWTFGLWGGDFIKTQKPSIQYLELFALCIGIYVWADKLQHKRVIIFCDNQAVVQMVNNYTSSCENCMRLLRLLVLKCLIQNLRITVRYIRSEENIL